MSRKVKIILLVVLLVATISLFVVAAFAISRGSLNSEIGIHYSAKAAEITDMMKTHIKLH